MRVGRCRPTVRGASKSRAIAVVVAVAACVAAVAPAARAQSPWRLIDNETVVAKTTCIRTDDVAVTPRGATAWVRDAYAATMRLPNGRAFRSARAQLVVDCAAQRWYVARVVAYDVGGAIVDDQASDTHDARAQRDFGARTPGSDLARGVCTMAAYKRQWAVSDAEAAAAP